MSPIKTCVLGVGLSGLTFHVPFLLALPELFELHSVLERNPKSAGGKVKERFGVEVKIHTTFEDVLKDEADEEDVQSTQLVAPSCLEHTLWTEAGLKALRVKPEVASNFAQQVKVEDANALCFEVPVIGVGGVATMKRHHLAASQDKN